MHVADTEARILAIGMYDCPVCYIILGRMGRERRKTILLNLQFPAYKLV